MRGPARRRELTGSRLQGRRRHAAFHRPRQWRTRLGRGWPPSTSTTSAPGDRCSWATPHPAVVDAITRQAARGTAFGAPTALEVEMAERIHALVPSDRRWFGWSTRAPRRRWPRCAWRAGRRAGRAIIKFEGCYHGHGDSFLVKAGSGAATFGTPRQPGRDGRDGARHA